MERAEYEVIDGRVLRLSHLGKLYFPAARFTKRDVIDYYRAIAPALLPHARGRPLTLKRYPEGVGGEYFYEKRCPSHRPGWIRTAREMDVEYCVIDDLASLVWAANLASIEIHTSLALADSSSQPTVMVFDLDPGAPADVMDCARVALGLKAELEGFGLRSFPKTSGSKGLQVYVPLNHPEATYDATKRFARTLAESMQSRYPDRVVSKMAKPLRRGKVLIDWSQNDRHKTTVCVYSLRALEHPTVSTPLRWTEVRSAVRSGCRADLVFGPSEVLERVRRYGDLFLSVLRIRQRLSRVRSPLR